MKDVVMKERKRINERRRHGREREREREGVYANERKETDIKRRERDVLVRYFVEEREKRDRLRGGKADTKREGEKESSFFSFINEEMVSNFCVGCISKKFSRPQTEWAEGGSSKNI